MKKIFALASLAIVLLAMNPVLASDWIITEPKNHYNRVETEIHTILGFGEPGAGFRVGIPVLKQGIVSTINDNVDISFGVDVLKWPKPDFGGAGVVAPVMLQWNFYLARNWDVFGEGGVAFQNWSDRDNNLHTFFMWPGLGVGARCYISPRNYPALIIRIGYPSWLTLGASF